MSDFKVFFYVQHLWGVGHVYRATRIARGLAEAGMEVHLVSGGSEIPGFDFTGIKLHRLTSVRSADVSFSELVHVDGKPFTEGDKVRRRDQLLALFREIRPDILITEAFPFGRRQMLFELLPLLEAAKKADFSPMVVASIRDIMQENRKEKRVNESNRLVKDYYDLILVHGDENLIRIEETLQGAETFLDKVRYTGLVTPDPTENPENIDFQCDVLVSVGGGAFGQELIETALQAMQHSKRLPQNWLIAAGTELSEDKFNNLKGNCPPGMQVVRHIPDLALAMKTAKVSVSHAGYNTVADILYAGCGSVLYPYTGGRETEQLRRAEILENMGLAVQVRPGQLSPETLAKAVDLADQKGVQQANVAMNGAQETASVLKNAYKEFQISHVD